MHCPFSPCLSLGSVANAGWDLFFSLSLIGLGVRAVEQIVGQRRGTTNDGSRDAELEEQLEQVRSYSSNTAHTARQSFSVLRFAPPSHFRATTALTCHGQPTHQFSPLFLSVINDQLYSLPPFQIDREKTLKFMRPTTVCSISQSLLTVARCYLIGFRIGRKRSMSAACTTEGRPHSAPPDHRSRTSRQSRLGGQHPGSLVIDCACHLSLCVQFPLSISQADDFLVPFCFPAM